ncbi:carbohydrate-binding protein [Kitasatospora sp. NBC_01250]|uniref:carbohydrate-binding protein n=1 Tax=Kitasatospora sp. NBC_01250 TaxID=2903571 RepID=UPI002E3405A7|nr:CBM35 domain-containing protein [Kitasatospora sp. NBC_01250]
MSVSPTGRSRRTPVPAVLLTLLALLLALATWSVTSASASSTVYEAENAALSGGAVVASDHSGYTGTGFVAGYTDGNKGTADTVFTVNAAGTGAYTASLRYANGTTATMTLSLYVNGIRTTQLSLQATADWNTWATVPATVQLDAGSNTIGYKFDTTDSGNVNLDNVTLAPVPPPPPGQYEAESAALSGGAVVASDHSGYTGSGFVAGYTDGNKGTADTVFTIDAANAGPTPVALRYANGTTATMTLSVYVNGTKIQQDQLPATADWNTWTTVTDNLTLIAGSNTIGYKFDVTDSGNVNLDNITVTSSGSSTGGGSGGQQYQAATAFYTGGPSVATSIPGYTGSGYLTGFTAQGALVDITVDVPSAGSYPVTLTYANTSGSTQTISLHLNGVRSGQLSLPAGNGWLTATQNLTLRSGVNLIGYQSDPGDTGDLAIDTVAVNGGSPLAAQGATVPYTEYQAATAQTNATVLPYSTSYPSLQAEATGRQAVQLTTTGQYVQVTLTRPANSIVLRYSIPDNSDGSTVTAPLALYADGSKIQDLSLTTQYSWLYGAGYYDTHSPSSGPAHHFFDETRALIGNWPAGTVLKLQKDAADTAASYTIDVLDTEQVDPAYTMPSGYVPVTNYGVTPDSGADQTSAINSALAAVSGTGQGLWFPTGTYLISGRLSLDNVAMRGAGQWYTTIRSTAPNGSGGLMATGGTNQIADLTIAGDQTFRNNDSGAAGIEGNFGSGSLIYDVWIEHAKVGIWTDSANGLYTVGARIRDVFADGLHYNGGTFNSRADQSVVRNTGDDELALTTQNGNVTGCVLANNTVSSPIQANGIGIYGGANNTVENNLVSDTVAFGSGITLSTAFGAGFSGPTTVSGNALVRAGSYNTNWNSSLGALWIYADQDDITQPITVQNNTISNASYQGVLLSYAKQISNLTLDHLAVSGAGTYGIDISDVTGSLTANYVTVTGAASGGLDNPGGYTIDRGPGDSGF